MSLNSNNLPSGSSGNIEPMEPATYPARTVCMVDLGLQAQKPWQGKDRPPVQMIALTYEFADEFLKDEDGNDIEDKPRWLTEMLNFYPLTAERAKSTARYNALDPSNVHNGDFSKIADVLVHSSRLFVRIVNYRHHARNIDDLTKISVMNIT